MDKDQLQRLLMETFLAEHEEHVQALNRDLLALEKSKPDDSHRLDLVREILRTAHSLKGAARSVNADKIEGACHRLESLLVPLRDGNRVLDPPLLNAIFALVDEIAERTEQVTGEVDSEAVRSTNVPRTASIGAAEAGGEDGRAKVGIHDTSKLSGPRSHDQGGTIGVERLFTVRISAEKLDTLLAQSGELLVALGSLGTWRDRQIALLGSVREWGMRWRRIPVSLKDVSSPSAVASGRRGSPGSGASAAWTEMGKVGQQLQWLESELEYLTTTTLTDQRTLAKRARLLDEEVRRVRMLPFSEACRGLARTARDLATASGKEATLLVEGSGVELDRSMLERLKDPLLHLVRNAVDHGLETVAERERAGKPREGQIRAGAALRGAQVEITVTDDGPGLDVDAICEQARKRDLPIPQNDQEAAQLIFSPGFSTARMITDISGRGVGLDVVRSQIEALHGRLDVSFERSRGTRITLTVPLTLTTIRALLVEAGGQLYAVPGPSVHQLARVAPEDLSCMGGREVLLHEGSPVPIASLATALGLSDRKMTAVGSRAQAVIVSAGGRQVAFAVDRLLAEQEVTVKSLGRRIRRVDNFAGATILPDGRVALILNAADLLRRGLERDAGVTLSEALACGAQETRRRLLVVDDSVTIRTVQRRLFEDAGYDVVTAVDGADAWSLLQREGADLVVADVEMPRMDGFTLTETIRRSGRFANLPVVLVTALGSEHDKARGLEVGANAYIVKSGFDQAVLLRTVEQLL